MVLVLVDHDHGQLDELSLQAVTYGRELAASTGEPLEALVSGPMAAVVAAVLGEHGVATVHVAVHDGLTDYAPLASARAASEVAARTDASVVLGDRFTTRQRGAGSPGRDHRPTGCRRLRHGHPGVADAGGARTLGRQPHRRGQPARFTGARRALVPHTVAAEPGGSASRRGCRVHSRAVGRRPARDRQASGRR